MGPICFVLAGPNGAGKTTLYSSLKPPGLFINADLIAAQLRPADVESVAVSAGRMALEQMDSELDARRSFTIETTLSGHQPLKLMRRAKANGYTVHLVFVALSSAALHIARVAQRVDTGGHDIRSDIIRRRYESSFEQLAVALTLADETLIFDNSFRSGYRLCLHLAGAQILANGLRRERPFDRRVARYVATGLGLAPSDLLASL